MYIHKTTALLTVVLLALAPIAVARGGDECPVAKRVDTLVASWKVAAKTAKAPTGEHAAVMKRASALKAECPVGSRLDVTLAAVRDTLAVVQAAGDCCADRCPLEKAGAKDALGAETYAMLSEMKRGRARALKGLHELARFAAGFTAGVCDGGSCAAGKVDGAVAATNASPCGTAGCPIRVASRLGQLKGAWAKAETEARAMPTAKKQEILQGFDAMAKAVKPVRLVPESVQALAMGFDALGKMQAKMAAFGKANPDFMATVPADVHRSFMMQAALLDEANGVLSSVVKTMKTMHGGACASGCAATGCTATGAQG